MYPSRKTQLIRISACRSDLTANGIDPDALGARGRRDLARRNLDYFQAMLGYDAGLRQVVELMRATGCPPRKHAAGTAHRAAGH
jgi:hypothetical protein